MIYRRVPTGLEYMVRTGSTPAFRNPVLLSSERPPKNHSTIDSRLENDREHTSTSILHHCTRHLVDTIITIRYTYTYIYIYVNIYKIPWMISISSMVVPSHRHHMHRTTTSIPPQQQRPRPLPIAIDLILPYHHQ